jgi:hypothetical protein
MGNVLLPSSAGNYYLIAQVMQNGALYSAPSASISAVQVVAPAVSAAFVGYAGNRALPASALGSSLLKGLIAKIQNAAGVTFTGTVAVQLYASTTPQVVAGQAPLAAVIRRVTFAAGRTVSLPLGNVTLPTAAGSYYLVAVATLSGNSSTAAVASTTTIAVSAAFTDVSIVKFPAPRVNANHHEATVELVLSNSGNIAAIGPATVTFTDPSGTVLGNPELHLQLLAGRAETVRLFIRHSLIDDATKTLTAVLNFEGELASATSAGPPGT